MSSIRGTIYSECFLTLFQKLNAEQTPSIFFFIFSNPVLELKSLHN